MSLHQAGGSPVRQLAGHLNPDELAEERRNLQHAAILSATAVLAQRYGITVTELLGRWSPYR